MAWHENFLVFEQRIRLDFDTNDHLRKKRKTLLDLVERDTPVGFTPFNQGSYALATAIWPLAGQEVDIDVGLEFEIALEDEDIDPVGAKKWVLHAVDGHTNVGQRMRKRCVTVHYAPWKGLPACHVDLAVFARHYGDLRLAAGVERTPVADREWIESDPQGLIEAVRDGLDGPERDQFRRVVRYLKRWKDFHFDVTSKGAPTGIALTLAAKTTFEFMPDDDLGALDGVVHGMLERFTRPFIFGQPRLVAELPVAPYNDVLNRMSDPQMNAFQTKLATLGSRLARAAISSGRVARGHLVDSFGDDFAI